MPPKVSFSKDDVLKEAFEIIRKKGLKALTARKIAEKLKSSTQPVYSAFGSMKNLESAVIEYAKEYAAEYLLENGGTDEPFFNMGLRYLRFAKEEKQLFHLVYLSGHSKFDFENPHSPFQRFLKRLKTDPSLEGLDNEGLQRIHLNMWIYTHGLTSLFPMDSSDYSEQFMRDCLYDMGGIVIEWEHSKKRQPQDLSMPCRRKL